MTKETVAFLGLFCKMWTKGQMSGTLMIERRLLLHYKFILDFVITCTKFAVDGLLTFTAITLTATFLIRLKLSYNI